MPSFSDHHSSLFSKVLYLGESGAGKTGSLISLIEAGYKLRILDFDNGLDYLVNLAKQRCPDKLENVHYVTITDPFTSNKGGILAGASAAAKAAQLINNWKTETEDLGPAREWGPDCVLVIDSLTFLNASIMRRVLYLNGRLNQHPQIQDWGAQQEMTENMLGLLYSNDFETNVVMTAHIKYLETLDGASFRGLPLVGGRQLPPKIGRFFNTMLLAERKGAGQNERRVISTRSSGVIELKAASPKVPAELPLNSGLAEYFKLVRAEPKTGE